jgi:cardiolipin synthase
MHARTLHHNAQNSDENRLVRQVNKQAVPPEPGEPRRSDPIEWRDRRSLARDDPRAGRYVDQHHSEPGRKRHIILGVSLCVIIPIQLSHGVSNADNRKVSHAAMIATPSTSAAIGKRTSDLAMSDDAAMQCKMPKVMKAFQAYARTPFPVGTLHTGSDALVRLGARFSGRQRFAPDKLNMFAATVVLAWQSRIPLWLAVAIIGRDVVIVGGALAYRVVRGHLDIKPTRLSKLNTAIEFAVLLLVMAAAAGWIDATAWMPPLFVVTFVTVMASGIQYVSRWGRMAFAERRRAP